MLGSKPEVVRFVLLHFRVYMFRVPLLSGRLPENHPGGESSRIIPELDLIFFSGWVWDIRELSHSDVTETRRRIPHMNSTSGSHSVQQHTAQHHHFKSHTHTLEMTANTVRSDAHPARVCVYTCVSDGTQLHQT